MATQKSASIAQTEVKRTKKEWIESAAYLGAERFEIAGALFTSKDSELVSESSVKDSLAKYKGGVQ